MRTVQADAVPITQSDQFRHWFRHSKLLTEDGQPQVFYHITTEDFREFRPGGRDATISGPAIWLSPYADYQAAWHNVGHRDQQYRDGARVLPLYVRMERPLLIDDQTMLGWARDVFAGGSREFPQVMTPQWVAALRDDYDGVIFQGEALGWGPKTNEILVFDPKQIKSVFSRGFSRDSADITAIGWR